MSRRRLLVGTAAVALVASVSAWATPPVQVAAAAGRVTLQSFERRQLDALARLGVPRSALSTAAAVFGRTARTQDGGTAIAVSSESSAEPLASVFPVGRLDGPGEAVLETRYPTSKGHPQVEFIVRRASDGHLLWSRTDALGNQDFEAAVPALTGAHRRPGLALIRFAIQDQGNGASIAVTLTGLSGAGKTLWTHHESGRFDDSGASALPELAGAFATGAQAPDALLLNRLDQTTDSSGNQSSALTMLRLSMSSGRVTAFGGRITSTTGAPQASSVNDLNGDRYNDAAVAIPGQGVEARNGHDGRTVWTNTAATVGADGYVDVVGDVVPSPSGAAAAGDLSVSSGPPPPGALSSFPVTLPVADPTATPHGTITLLNGATGATVWSKTGDGSYAVARAGVPSVPAVGIYSSDTSQDVTGSGSTTVTLTLTTYDVSGAQIYSTSYSTSAPGDGSGNGSFGYGAAFPIGDFEPDGAIDGVASLFVVDGNNFRSQDILFHGVDGHTFAGNTPQPLWASATGHGDDFVVVSTQHDVTVHVERGRDLATVFSTRLPRTSGITATDTYGANLTGVSRADVFSCGAGKTSDYCAELTGAGRVRWLLHFKPSPPAATGAQSGSGSGGSGGQRSAT